MAFELETRSADCECVEGFREKVRNKTAQLCCASRLQTQYKQTIYAGEFILFSQYIYMTYLYTSFTMIILRIAANL